MSADVDLDAVGSCILFYCGDLLLALHVLLPFTGFHYLRRGRPAALQTETDIMLLGILRGIPASEL